MSIEQAIIAALQSLPALTEVFGVRIYSAFAPVQLTDLAEPSLVYQRISNVREQAHNGKQNLSRLRYQFSITSSDRAAVDAARDILTEALDCFEFTATGGLLLTFFHADDHAEFSPETRTHTAVVDFYIWANA